MVGEKILVLCGKTASGKDTILHELCENNKFRPMISYTTRPPRSGEVNGEDYYFVSDEEFQSMADEGEFFETTAYTVASGDDWRYGSSKKDYEQDHSNRIAILNPEGVKKLRECGIDAVVVLLLANENERWNRLRQRGDDSAEARRRMNADDEDFINIEEYIDFAIRNDRKMSKSEVSVMIQCVYLYMNGR